MLDVLRRLYSLRICRNIQKHLLHADVFLSMGSIPCLPTSKFARKKLQCSYKDPEMYKANLQGVFCEDILWDYLGLGQDTPATDIEFKTKAILDWWDTTNINQQYDRGVSEKGICWYTSNLWLFNGENKRSTTGRCGSHMFQTKPYGSDAHSFLCRFLLWEIHVAVVSTGLFDMAQVFYVVVLLTIINYTWIILDVHPIYRYFEASYVAGHIPSSRACGNR